MIKLLIVDDEAIIVSVLQPYKEGYDDQAADR